MAMIVSSRFVLKTCTVSFFNSTLKVSLGSRTDSFGVFADHQSDLSCCQKSAILLCGIFDEDSASGGSFEDSLESVGFSKSSTSQSPSDLPVIDFDLLATWATTCLCADKVILL